MALSIRVHLQVLHTVQIAAARSNCYLKAEAIFAADGSGADGN